MGNEEGAPSGSPAVAGERKRATGKIIDFEKYSI